MHGVLAIGARANCICKSMFSTRIWFVVEQIIKKSATLSENLNWDENQIETLNASTVVVNCAVICAWKSKAYDSTTCETLTPVRGFTSTAKVIFILGCKQAASIQPCFVTSFSLGRSSQLGSEWVQCQTSVACRCSASLSKPICALFGDILRRKRKQLSLS